MDYFSVPTYSKNVYVFPQHSIQTTRLTKMVTTSYSTTAYCTSPLPPLPHLSNLWPFYWITAHV